ARGTVERVRDALSADGAALYFAEHDGWRAAARSGSLPVEPELRPRDPLTAALAIASTCGAPCEIAGGLLAAPIIVGPESPRAPDGGAFAGASAALLVAAAPGRRLDDEDHELLAALADGLAVALSNARAHGALRAATEQLQQEAATAERRRREIARLKERV